MRFTVTVVAPSGAVQHVIHAENEGAARERARRAHPKARAIFVEEGYASSAAAKMAAGLVREAASC